MTEKTLKMSRFLRKRFIRNFLVFSLFVICVFTAFSVKSNYAPAQTGESEIVMETVSNRVLYGKNIDQKKFMASTTKILTAITIIENCNVEDIVTVTADTVGVEGSSIYLEAGEKLTVKDLLYGLMLRSGNDCAETLAVYCSGDIKTFAELMNITAKKIGAENSNFINPHGLHDDNHYTTAYDLALISCYAIKNPIFKEIVSAKSADIPFTTRNRKRRLINKNKMLSRLEGCTGIKTGFTKKAGRCLVTSCERNGMEVICVVLNCGPMWDVSEQLINNAFNDYSIYKLAEKNNIAGFITDKKSGKKYPLYIKNDVLVPLTEKESQNLKIVYDYPQYSDGFIEKDKEAGAIKIYYQNNLLFSEKIYTITNVS